MAIATNASLGSITQGAVKFKWISGAVIAVTDQTTAMAGFDSLSQATLFLNTTAASGTTPTMNVIVQKLLPDGVTWHDAWAFSQVTGVSKRIMSLVSGGNKEEAQSSGTLAAGTLNAVAFSGTWRINAVIGGTNPSFTFTLWFEGLA